MEIIEKQFQEERARVPKANPYPYTTDYPVVTFTFFPFILMCKWILVNGDKSYAGSSKTRTQELYKTRTLPIGESGAAWGGDAKRDGRKTEKGERRGTDEGLQSPTNSERVSVSNIRDFYLERVERSILNPFSRHLCRDPIPALEKARKPLTQVQEFNLHVNYRAVERAEFDQKVKS